MGEKDGEVVGARADAPGFSVARAACMHFRDLECGTPELGSFFCLPPGMADLDRVLPKP